MLVLPVIVPGVAGGAALTATASVWTVELPQALTAETVMLPLVVLATLPMEMVVELPVQALGSAQV